MKARRRRNRFFVGRKDELRTIVEVRNDRARLSCGHFVDCPQDTLALVGGARVGNGIPCPECERIKADTS